MTIKEWAIQISLCDNCGDNLCGKHFEQRNGVQTEVTRDEGIRSNAFKTGHTVGYSKGYNQGERTQAQFPRGEGG